MSVSMQSLEARVERRIQLNEAQLQRNDRHIRRVQRWLCLLPWSRSLRGALAELESATVDLQAVTGELRLFLLNARELYQVANGFVAAAEAYVDPILESENREAEAARQWALDPTKRQGPDRPDEGDADG